MNGGYIASAAPPHPLPYTYGALGNVLIRYSVSIERYRSSRDLVLSSHVWVNADTTLESLLPIEPQNRQDAPCALGTPGTNRAQVCYRPRLLIHAQQVNDWFST